MIYKVKLVWDEEAAVWIATCKDVPGLVLESGSFDALIERVKNAIPELLSLNGTNQNNFYISYAMKREDKVAAYG